MERLVRIASPLIALLLLVAGIHGCYSSPEAPSAQQEEFVLEIRRLNSEIGRLNGEGRDAALKGKLPPADLEARLESKRAEVSAFLRDGTPTAIGWNARIHGLARSDGYVILKTSYKEQLYELRVFDEEAKLAAADNFALGDKITFSGDLGPEQSLTQEGAFLNPTFVIYPTSIRKGDVEVVQPIEGIPGSDK